MRDAGRHRALQVILWPQVFLAEMQRILKPDGLLLFLTPNWTANGGAKMGYTGFQHQTRNGTRISFVY